MLMTSSTKKQNPTETNEFVVQKSLDVFPCVDEKKLWDKRTALSVLGLPSKNRSKKVLFPEELLLGPDQIKAINSEADSTFVIGEAGTGKTLVLLAVLFKYTGKHVNEKKLRQVIFFIPESKIHFRKDVEVFIKKYCQEDWVQIRGNFDNLQGYHDLIYLLDEFYDWSYAKVSFSLIEAKFWVVVVSTSYDVLCNPIFVGSIKIIYLRQLYRSDPLISKLCAKISRLVYQKRIEANDKMPWTWSTGDGIPYKSQNPIQVHLNQKNSNLKFCENEQNLVVYWNEEDFIENSSQEKSNVIMCHLEGYSLDDLPFTGSEFDNVVLVAGRNIDTTSQEFLIVLYKIISGTRKNLTVFSHLSNLAEFKSLLLLSDTGVYFDKQRYDNNLSSRVFPNLPLMEKEEFRCLESSQSGSKLSVVPTVHDEDAQSLYRKAFEAFFTADVNYLSSLMYFLASSLSKTSNYYLYGTSANRLTKVLQLMIDKNPSIFLFCTRVEIFDLIQKMCAYFSNDTHLILLHFPDFEDFVSESGKWTEIGQMMETSNFQAGNALNFFNAEEFYQLLKKQAITSENFFTNFDGSFMLLTFAITKLNPDQFTEFLKSAGVDSLKLSDEQFLDDERNNILMYCATRTTHFCIVADWALEQGYLDELLSQRNCYGDTCFVLACECDNFVLVKELLQKYQYDWLTDGFNAISALCENGNMLIFQHLISTLKGENIKMKIDSMRDSDGMNYLMRTTCNTKMMDTFIKFSMKENFVDTILYEKDARGHSCLFWAAAFQNIESIKMLTERYKYNWKADRDNIGRTIAHVLCSLETPDVLKFLIANYGHEFIEVAQKLDYTGCSCLEIACFVGRSVELVQMVLDSLNDSFPLPQNFSQLLRGLVAASKGNGENKNKIIDYLVSHMLAKLSLGHHEDEIKQHYLVYASDSEDILKIGVRILVGPEELEEADFGEPETFSLGSW